MHQSTTTPPGEGVPTPEEGHRIFMRLVDELGLSVPYQADRWADLGEVCTCGAPALVAYDGTKYGTLGFCGGRHG